MPTELGTNRIHVVEGTAMKLNQDWWKVVVVLLAALVLGPLLGRVFPTWAVALIVFALVAAALTAINRYGS